MKFVISSAQLLRQLQVISGALHSGSPLPILDNFLFELDGNNKLRTSASDLETTMSSTGEVEGKDQGKIAIPSRKLIDLLKTFSDQPLTFKVNKDSHQVDISSDAGKFRLSGFNAEEYPRIPSVEKSSSLEMPGEVLLEAINRTLFATSNDDLRPVMTGVFCQFGKEGATFVATDAHRLVRYRRKDISAVRETSFILPKKPLSLLKASLPGTGTQVKIEFNEVNAFFSFDRVEIICRLIDGRYPAYEAVIPPDNPNKMTIDREPFLNAIRRVSIFSNKTTHQVKFRIAGSQVDISAEDTDFGDDANEKLSCQYDGKDIEIAFNARFMADMLQNISTQMVEMEMSLPNRAGLLSPARHESDPNTDLLMLVMPVMIN